MNYRVCFDYGSLTDTLRDDFPTAAAAWDWLRQDFATLLSDLADGDKHDRISVDDKTLTVKFNNYTAWVEPI